MDAPAIDRAVRWRIYAGLRDTSEVPAHAAIAEALGIGIGDVEASLLRLHEAHVLVLYEGTTEVRMALPFAARATPFAVHVGDRRWWANCDPRSPGRRGRTHRHGLPGLRRGDAA